MPCWKDGRLEKDSSIFPIFRYTYTSITKALSEQMEGAGGVGVFTSRVERR